jgi:hypothetical protein
MRFVLFVSVGFCFRALIYLRITVNGERAEISIKRSVAVIAGTQK